MQNTHQRNGQIFDAPHEKGSREWRVFARQDVEKAARLLRKVTARWRPSTDGFNILILDRLYR
jgi:hypothetical protein